MINARLPFLFESHLHFIFTMLCFFFWAHDVFFYFLFFLSFFYDFGPFDARVPFRDGRKKNESSKRVPSRSVDHSMIEAISNGGRCSP